MLTGCLHRSLKMSQPFPSGDARAGLQNDTGEENGKAGVAAAGGETWVPPVSYDYEQYAKPADQSFAPNGEGESGGGWGHNAAKYEWQEEFGEIGPKNEDLEKVLFSSEHQTRKGVKYDE